MKMYKIFLIIMIINNCYCYTTDNKSYKEIQSSDSIKNASVMLSIDFNYEKSNVINIDERHYKFISNFLESFQKMKVFNRI